MKYTKELIVEKAFEHNFDYDAMSRGLGYKSYRNLAKYCTTNFKKNPKELVEELMGKKGPKHQVKEETPKSLAALEKVAQERGFDVNDVAYYWDKTDEISAFVKRAVAGSAEDFTKQIINEMRQYAPIYDRIRYRPGEHLLVIDPADVHIGKLVEEATTGYKYGRKKAVNRLREAVSQLVQKAEMFGIERIQFIIGNDILHVDNNQVTTTGGTRQDHHGSPNSAWLDAFKVYRDIIEELSLFAPVSVIHCMSNHDHRSGWMLAQALWAWFHNNPNVSFGENQGNITDNQRKYSVYGNNLLVYDHGDGSKEKDWGAIVAFEAREAWSKVKFCYVMLHHIHHKDRKSYGMNGKHLREKDHIGVTVIRSGIPVDPGMNIFVEYIRSPSPPDQWHSKSGYINQQAIECFLYHPQNGQVARFTHYF